MAVGEGASSDEHAARAASAVMPNSMRVCNDMSHSPVRMIALGEVPVALRDPRRRRGGNAV
jgi:hypothetical protein